MIHYLLKQRVIFDSKMKTMTNYISLLFLGVILFSCSVESKENLEKQADEKAQKEMPNVLDYFYPKDTTVYMYVYQNVNNPEDRYVERVVYREIEGADHYFISRYNMKLEPKATMTYWVLDNNIELMKANIMVGRVSYESKISSGQFFPSTGKSVGKISYDYPENDSIINVIEVNRKFDRKDVIEEGEHSTDVIVFQDSIRLTRVDIKNKQDQAFPAFMYSYFGKGIGKVREENKNRTYQLVLRTTAKDFGQIK